MAILPKLYSKQKLEEFKANFINELTAAKNNSGSSISYNKTEFLPFKNKQNKKIQLMVIGGTNFKSATGEFINRNLEIKENKFCSLTKFNKSSDLGDFFVKQLLKDIEIVAINFAYPVKFIERNKRMDGNLVKGTKGNLFEGLINKNIGEFLEEYTFKKIKRRIKISLANDIVCELLSSNLTSTGSRIGFIVGTGFNTGFVDNKSIINLESGNFNRFDMSESGVYIDEKSNNLGQQRWEKEVSGAYICQHYNYYAKLNGLEKLNKTRYVSQIASKSSGIESEIARLILQRSSSLVAVSYSAILDFLDSENGDLIIEGGFFWKGYNYVGYFIDNLKKLDVDLSQNHILKYDDPYYALAKLVGVN